MVVEPLEADEKSAGGILLPDTAKQKPQRGRVLAVGPGKLLESGSRSELSVAKGDEVIYGRYAGNDVEVEREGNQDHARERYPCQGRQVNHPSPDYRT